MPFLLLPSQSSILRTSQVSGASTAAGGVHGDQLRTPTLHQRQPRAAGDSAAPAAYQHARAHRRGASPPVQRQHPRTTPGRLDPAHCPRHQRHVPPDFLDVAGSSAGHSRGHVVHLRNAARSLGRPGVSAGGPCSVALVSASTGQHACGPFV